MSARRSWPATAASVSCFSAHAVKAPATYPIATMATAIQAMRRLRPSVYSRNRSDDLRNSRIGTTCRRSHETCCLGGEEVVVKPTSGEQLVVRPVLGDAAPVEDDDPVGPANRREAVRHDDRRGTGGVGEQSVERL